jgi:nicotinamidase-related amidase
VSSNFHIDPVSGENDFKPELAPLADGVVIPLRTDSAFVGNDLEARLRARLTTHLWVGVITNNFS